MSNENPAAPDKGVAPETATRAKSRRRFVQGVGVLVPTILTVSARSSLAATCLSPSASASVNLTNSRPDRPADGVCTGLSPGYWKNRGYPPATLIDFGSVYAGGFPGVKMFNALSMQGNGNFQALARHLAAAWCNLDSGRVSANILSLQDLQDMWVSGRTGDYAPIAGNSIRWGEYEIVSYIKTTMS